MTLNINENNISKIIHMKSDNMLGSPIINSSPFLNILYFIFYNKRSKINLLTVCINFYIMY